MRIIRKEFGSDYQRYHFGYSIWGILEPGDQLNEVYAEGFLPYSGHEYHEKTLYMARSIRIDLQRLQLNSENRRILRKADWQFTRTAVPFESFDANPAFLSFCNRYFRLRHKRDILRSGKLRAVLSSGFVTEVVAYNGPKGHPVGYVLIVSDERMSHFWFSFYDLSYMRRSLGMWMMIQEVLAARDKGKSSMYLGTCYGEGALYKTNFDAVEWWTGCGWSDDVKQLKHLAREEIKHSAEMSGN